MKLNIYSGNFHSTTAGLSPTGERVELFLAGCKMAREGHPCPGCFNKDLWSDKERHLQETDEIINYIISMTDNRYITIVGGEPLDQHDALVELCKKLKLNKFHICLITHYTMEEIIKMEINNPFKILNFCNLIIDGKYDSSKRVFDTNETPGIHHVIGSSNQRMWWYTDGIWIDLDIFSPNNKRKDLCYFYC